MCVLAVMANDVQVATGAGGEAAPKLLGQGGVERAERFVRHIGQPDHEGPAAQVDGGRHQRFIHGHGGAAVTADTGLVAQRLRHRLAKADADVFYGVMRVHVQVAQGRHR